MNSPSRASHYKALAADRAAGDHRVHEMVNGLYDRDEIEMEIREVEHGRPFRMCGPWTAYV